MAEDEGGVMKSPGSGAVLCRWVQSQLGCVCLGMAQQLVICKEEGLPEELKQHLADP